LSKTLCVKDESNEAIANGSLETWEKQPGSACEIQLLIFLGMLGEGGHGE